MSAPDKNSHQKSHSNKATRHRLELPDYILALAVASFVTYLSYRYIQLLGWSMVIGVVTAVGSLLLRIFQIISSFIAAGKMANRRHDPVIRRAQLNALDAIADQQKARNRREP